MNRTEKLSLAAQIRAASIRLLETTEADSKLEIKAEIESIKAKVLGKESVAGLASNASEAEKTAMLKDFQLEAKMDDLNEEIKAFDLSKGHEGNKGGLTPEFLRIDPERRALVADFNGAKKSLDNLRKNIQPYIKKWSTERREMFGMGNLKENSLKYTIHILGYDPSKPKKVNIPVGSPKAAPSKKETGFGGTDTERLVKSIEELGLSVQSSIFGEGVFTKIDGVDFEFTPNGGAQYEMKEGDSAKGLKSFEEIMTYVSGYGKAEPARTGGGLFPSEDDDYSPDSMKAFINKVANDLGYDSMTWVAADKSSLNTPEDLKNWRHVGTFKRDGADLGYMLMAADAKSIVLGYDGHRLNGQVVSNNQSNELKELIAGLADRESVQDKLNNSISLIMKPYGADLKALEQAVSHLQGVDKQGYLAPKYRFNLETAEQILAGRKDQGRQEQKPAGDNEKPIAYKGMEIYPDKGEWILRTEESLSSGRVFGDIFSSAEEAKAEADKLTAEKEKRESERAELNRLVKEEQLNKDTTNARYESFLAANNLSGIQAKRAISALEKQYRIDGKPTTRREDMERRAAEGWRVVVEDGERILEDKNGEFIFSLAKATKIGMDYFEWFKQGGGADTASLKTETSLGLSSEVETSRGTEVETRFKVIEGKNLKASNNTDGTVNPEFPSELQPRDRTRAGSVAQVQTISSNLKPKFLGDSALASQGAPIVGKDNAVESGNGRTMAIKKAYKEGNAEAYKAWIIDNAAKFGLKAADFENMKEPILVRERQTELDRVQFAKEANQSDLQAMSPLETAKTDAQAIDDAMMYAFEPSESGDLLAASNRGFVSKFMTAIGGNDASSLMTANGEPNQQAQIRMQSAIFAKAFNDDRLIAMSVEDTTDEQRNILKAMNNAAPAFIEMRALSEDAANQMSGGLADGIEMSLDQEAMTALTGAAELIRQARRDGQDIKELVKQQGLFGEIPPSTAALAIFISENNRSSARLAESFKLMAQEVNNELIRNRKAVGDMFGEPEPVTLSDILNRVGTKLDVSFGYDGMQGDMLNPAEPPAIEPVQEVDYQSRLNALKTQPINDIDSFNADLDELMGELEEKGLDEQFEADLNEILDRVDAIIEEQGV